MGTKKKEKINLVNEGSMPKLIEFLVYLHKNEPGYFRNEHTLKHRMAQTWKSLSDPNFCPNCGASMKGYLYEFDYHDAKLLISMGEEVRHRLRKGYSFTEANKVNVSHLNCDYTAKSKKTQAAKLGLIAQLLKDGERVPSTWVITERGFRALRGEPVPKRVKVWRNQIQDRYEDVTITIDEIMERNDEKYKPDEWYEATGPNQGQFMI